MTHASLCKKTHGKTWRLQASKIIEMGFPILAILLFFASATLVSAQIAPTSVPNATIGVAYSVQITETGLPEDTEVAWGYSGNLPPGLTLNTQTMAESTTITGTPTAAGTYSFTVEAEYSYSAPVMNSQTYTINVSSGCNPTVSPASPLPPADVNVAYTTVEFMVLGCAGQFTFSVPSSIYNPNPLPPGFKLTQGGIFSGTPSTAGTFTFPLTITDQYSNQTVFEYSITVNPPPTFSTGSPLPNGPVGVPYSLQMSATGGVPPYVYSMNDNPPGITITESGLLNGTPTSAGTYNFNIGVTDSVHGQTSAPFQVTFTTDVSQLQVSPQSLTFNVNANGNPPGPLAISIVPASGAASPATFRVVVDNGQSGTATPAWISVSPAGNVAPTDLVVSVNQGTMPAGSYPARIQVLDSNGLASDVAVTLNVTSVSQQLTPAPTALNFTARSANPGALTEEIAVSNSGAGTLPFTASVVGGSAWISSVTAGAGSTTPNAPVFVQVQVNSSGLAVGAYHDAILLTSSAGNVEVPVSLFVASSGPILGLNTTGVLFQAVEGGGSTVTQTVQVLNLGDPSSTVNWTASLVSGSNWLSLGTSSGTATSSSEGSLTLSLAPNATQLTPGPYYAIVKVTDPSSLNSPQYVTAVLNLEPKSAAAVPTVIPGGLLFTTSVGTSTALPSQQVQINASSASAVGFDVVTTTADNGMWLSATPTSGSVSGQAAGSIAVSVNPSGMVAGIYSGQVNISVGTVLQSVNVTLIVSAVTSSNARAGLEPHASACTASKLAITETGLPNNFAVPAGWPATLIVQLDNDCASPVTTGNVIASFSNGDAPLNLVADNLGNYSATWQPGNVNASMVVTLNAAASGLQSATAKLYGGIDPNQTPPPTVAPNGTVNNLNPVAGAALSPGTIAQIYGTGLGTAAVSTGGAPLPTMFNNTFALIGSTEAPLYFLSSGQINIQIPFEATATQQTPIVLSVNNALTIPQMLDVVPATPGVLSDDTGPNPSAPQNGAHIIAQHSADYSLVTSSKPAAPGEYLIMYLVGMGATNPAVASGAESPSSPPASVTSQPTVTVGSQPASVAFAGLTPGFVGLYQVNFQVPMGASSGELEVDVTQNGVAANPTLLPVN